MRDLTAEVLNKLKPSWATHYRTNLGEVMFESETKWCAIGLNFPFIERGPFKQKSKLTKCKPIPPLNKSKQFDITQHEWSDVIAEIEPESGHTLVIKSHGSWLSFDKDDVIAMARDRGLTAEDLK